MTTILDKLRNLLTGEPLRMIGYGAIGVVFAVTRIAPMLGYQIAQPSLDEIALAVAAAVTIVTEFARRYVFSPNSVAAIALRP